MGRVVVSEFVTLDGVMEDPGGAEQFAHGGWAFKFDRGEAGTKYKVDELMVADALLLGRATYEGFAAAWPKMNSDEFGKKMNSMPKYVVSSTLTDPSWTNSTVISGRRPARRGQSAQGRGRRAAGRRQRPARAGAVERRVGRRVAPDGLSDRPWRRQAALPRGQREPINFDLVYSAPAGQTLLLTYHKAAS